MKHIPYILQAIVILLWALLVMGGEYFHMHGFLKVSTCLLVFCVGVFMVIKRVPLANAMQASEETMRQKGAWLWTSLQGWHSKTRESFLQIIGWVFMLFAILGIFGLVRVGGR